MAAALAVLGGLGLPACTSPRNALGDATGRCYEALPVARAALHGAGRFAGARYLTVDALTRSLSEMHPRVVDVPARPASGRSAVCVVAYAGRFDASRVERGWAVDARTGRFALVVVAAPSGRLLATLVLETVPLRFGGLFAIGQ